MTITWSPLTHTLLALAIVGVGFLLAPRLRWLTERVLTRRGFDRTAEQVGLADRLTAAGVRDRPARIAGWVMHALVVIAAVVLAVDQLVPLSVLVREGLDYAPHLVLAAAILLAGIAAGDALGRELSQRASRAGVLEHRGLGNAVRALVVLLAVLLALQQLTIAASFVLDVALVVLAGVTLAVATAVALGTRTVVENLAGARYAEQHFRVGDVITAPEFSGTIERLAPTSVTLLGDDGVRIVVPNALLARSVVRTIRPDRAAEPGADPAM